MFAIISWVQESGLIDENLGAKKGFLALITGTILYFTIPSKFD